MLQMFQHKEKTFKVCLEQTFGRICIVSVNWLSLKRILKNEKKGEEAMGEMVISHCHQSSVTRLGGFPPSWTVLNNTGKKMRWAGGWNLGCFCPAEHTLIL